MAQTGFKEYACIAGDLVQSLGWEDALEKEMATHSSILAWRIPRTEEPGGPHPMVSVRTDTFHSVPCRDHSVYDAVFLPCWVTLS